MVTAQTLVSTSSLRRLASPTLEPLYRLVPLCLDTPVTIQGAIYMYLVSVEMPLLIIFTTFISVVR
jgi:hypothetical protein